MFDAAALIAAFAGIAAAVVSLLSKALSGWFVSRQRLDHADLTITRADGSMVRIAFKAGDIGSAEQLIAELTRAVADQVQTGESSKVKLPSGTEASQTDAGRGASTSWVMRRALPSTANRKPPPALERRAAGLCSLLLLIASRRITR